MASLLYLQLSASSSSSCLLVEPRGVYCSRNCEIDLWRSIVSRGSFECRASRGPYWDNGGRFRFRSEDELFRDEMFSRFELGRRKKKKDWWFDDDDDDDDEDYADWMDDGEGWSMVFEVVRALSWTLAPIGVSLLLGTDTDSKAGLMALAVPLVQSLISLVISKVWSRPSTRPMKRTRRETFSRSTAVGNVRSRNYRQVENGAGKDKGGYKSWMVGDTDSNGEQSRYGGWDDLDTQKDIRNGDMYSRSKQQFKKRASRRRWRVKEKPFLWRMLIAAFPFLDSWTKMLY